MTNYNHKNVIMSDSLLGSSLLSTVQFFVLLFRAEKAIQPQSYDHQCNGTYNFVLSEILGKNKSILKCVTNTLGTSRKNMKLFLRQINCIKTNLLWDVIFNQLPETMFRSIWNNPGFSSGTQGMKHERQPLLEQKMDGIRCILLNWLSERRLIGQNGGIT